MAARTFPRMRADQRTQPVVIRSPLVEEMDIDQVIQNAAGVAGGVAEKRRGRGQAQAGSGMAAQQPVGAGGGSVQRLVGKGQQCPHVCLAVPGRQQVEGRVCGASLTDDVTRCLADPGQPFRDDAQGQGQSRTQPRQFRDGALRRVRGQR